MMDKKKKSGEERKLPGGQTRSWKSKKTKQENARQKGKCIIDATRESAHDGEPEKKTVVQYH